MATNPTSIRLTLNLNPSDKMFSGVAVKSSIENALDKTRNLVLQDVVFYAAKTEQDRLQTRLSQVFTNIVEAELQRMARDIGRLAIGINGRYIQPPGQLKIDGKESQAMAGKLAPVTYAGATGYWPARTQRYLKQKKRKFGHIRWYENTGDLRKYLTNSNTYTEAYGGIKVSFEPHKIERSLNLANVSSIAPRRGRRSEQYTTGTIHLSVLGRIYESDLADAGKRNPSPWHTGLFDALKSSEEKKLLGTQERYRSMLEPFLSFYLTRAIPNAVFRKIEDDLRSTKKENKENVFGKMSN